MKMNKKAKDYRVDFSSQLAGGYGVNPAKQGPEALLRRAVMACLLWENSAYESGNDTAKNIAELIPKVDPTIVATIAIDARTKQKLRHVPLFIACEMAHHKSHRKSVGELLPEIIKRPDEITEFMALYWRNGKCPLANQVKKGLAAAFNNFDEYQFAKYNRDTEIKLRDVLFLVHPYPHSVGNMLAEETAGVKKLNYRRGPTLRHQDSLFTKLVNGTLKTPDTWEVSLSGGKDKRGTWERLISDKKLGALAFLRNLRNMQQAKVDPSVIQQGFKTVNPRMLLPLNYFAAAKHAPDWMREIEGLMLKGFENFPKLPGYTVFVVDVSGSMRYARISSKSDFNRLDAAAAMTVLASELCERVAIYATAGSDPARTHRTEKLPPYRGFALAKEVTSRLHTMGGGGIFTRQCLNWIEGYEEVTPDRIIVFSDSQDCDYPGSGVPQPFGKRNYIIDVSSYAKGVAYDGVWTAEISGWSEHFLEYIAALESENNS